MHHRGSADAEFPDDVRKARRTTTPFCKLIYDRVARSKELNCERISASLDAIF